MVWIYAPLVVTTVLNQHTFRYGPNESLVRGSMSPSFSFVNDSYCIASIAQL